MPVVPRVRANTAANCHLAWTLSSSQYQYGAATFQNLLTSVLRSGPFLLLLLSLLSTSSFSFDSGVEVEEESLDDDDLVAKLVLLLLLGRLLTLVTLDIIVDECLEKQKPTFTTLLCFWFWYRFVQLQHMVDRLCACCVCTTPTPIIFLFLFHFWVKPTKL